MNARLAAPNVRQVTKLFAGVCLGVAVASLVSPEPVAVPAVGTVSGVLVGALALLVGAVLYVEPWQPDDADCGCGEDCGC